MKKASFYVSVAVVISVLIVGLIVDNMWRNTITRDLYHECLTNSDASQMECSDSVSGETDKKE